MRLADALTGNATAIRRGVMDAPATPGLSCRVAPAGRTLGGMLTAEE